MRATIRRSALVLAAVVLLGVAASAAWRDEAAPGASAAAATRASGLLLLPPAAPAGQMVLYGHIRTLSEHTVKTHVTHIFQKLGLRDRTQAVIVAYESALVRPGE